MTWPHFHRWSEWTTEFEECANGWLGVYELRSRHCLNKRCDMTEEIPRCVSVNWTVLRLYEEQRGAT